MKKNSRKADKDMSIHIKETIRAFHRYRYRLGDDDMFSAGVTKIHITRLLELEHELREGSKERLLTIGVEVVRLIGDLCKFLIRYHLQGILRKYSLLYTCLSGVLPQGRCAGGTALGAILI
jgi:hypothetical protein